MPSKISQQPRLLRSTRSRLPSTQGGIRSFTKAAKPGATAIDAKKKPVSFTTSSKKRRLDESDDYGSDDAIPAVETTELKLPKVRKLSDPAAASPSAAARRSKNKTPPSPSSSSSSSSSLSRASSVDAASSPDRAETSPSSLSSSFLSDQSDTTSTSRPLSFDDLISLHSSFLAALSIHFAHNGASTPADIKGLCQHMEKIWKKRKVVVKDIQRIVHVLGGPDRRTTSQGSEDMNADFRIADRGHGKVCLEIPDIPDQAGFSMPFDESRLSEIFARNLERLWEERATKVQQSESSDDEFAESIPLAPIHNSVSTFNPLRKGQLRLQDLKAGVVIVKSEREIRAKKALEVSSMKKSAKATMGRRLGLLERIKNKEVEQSKLPPPPSKDNLLRQSAAQRVEDVAGVLLQLRPPGSAEMDSSNPAPVRKKPYKLANVVQNVQDSTGSSISKQEIEMCLEILAQKSVAGDWVSIIAMGKLKSVVLKSGNNVSPRDIAMKVAKQGET